jgi:hypothetical protein
MNRALCFALLSLFMALPAHAQGRILRGVQLREAVLANVKSKFGDVFPGRRLHYKVLPPAAKYHGPIRNVLVSTAKIKARDTHLYNVGTPYSDFVLLKTAPGAKLPRTKVFGGAQIDLRTGKMFGDASG